MCGLGDPHRLDNERRRDCNPGHHQQGGKQPRLPSQREKGKAKRRQGECDGELTRERKMPASAAVSKAAERAAPAHQAEEHTGKGCIRTLYRVRGEADLEKTECGREAKNDSDEPGRLHNEAANICRADGTTKSAL